MTNFKSLYGDLYRNPLHVLGGAVCLFVFAFTTFLFSLPARHAAAEGIAPAAHATITDTVRPLEIHIANNGLVLLRSAKVVSVHGTTIILDTAWGSADFRWVVLTNAGTFETRNFGTHFMSRDGTDLSLSDIHAGDIVTVTGTLDSSAREPTLEADSVRKLQ